MTLVEFLLARIAEDESHARLVIERGGAWNAPPISPERTLAECAAKRKIVEELRGIDVYAPNPPEGSEVYGYRQALLGTVEALAAVYPDCPKGGEAGSPGPS